MKSFAKFWIFFFFVSLSKWNCSGENFHTFHAVSLAAQVMQSTASADSDIGGPFDVKHKNLDEENV